MSILSPFVIFHGGLELLYRCSFPLKTVPGCSQSHCWLLALFVDFVLPFPPNKQSSQMRACQVLCETIRTRALVKHARPIRRRGKMNRAVQLSREQNEALPGPVRRTRVHPKSAIVLCKKNLKGHRAPSCGLSIPTNHTRIPSPSLCRSVRPGWGGKKRISLGIPTHLFSSQQQTLSKARQTACLAAKALNMPQQSDWVLKAGLRFNIQCANSLTFYLSLQ